MEKTDKRLLALAAALILTAIIWFAHYSRTLHTAIITESIVQILDATKGDHAGPSMPAPKVSQTGRTGCRRPDAMPGGLAFTP